jgi:uncharacterized membrane protein
MQTAVYSATVTRKHPLHPALIPVPVTLLTGALFTDVAYWSTAQILWANFSAWLLAAAMVTGVLAAVAILVDVVTRRPATDMRWPVLIGYFVSFVLGLINSFIHSRDAWTSVVPAGLILSVLTVLVLLITGWLHWIGWPTTTVEPER